MKETDLRFLFFPFNPKFTQWQTIFEIKFEREENIASIVLFAPLRLNISSMISRRKRFVPSCEARYAINIYLARAKNNITRVVFIYRRYNVFDDKI